jgi:uncharacterized membrane protein
VYLSIWFHHRYALSALFTHCTGSLLECSPTAFRIASFAGILLLSNLLLCMLWIQHFTYSFKYISAATKTSLKASHSTPSNKFEHLNDFSPVTLLALSS